MKEAPVSFEMYSDEPGLFFDGTMEYIFNVLSGVDGIEMDVDIPGLLTSQNDRSLL